MRRAAGLAYREQGPADGPVALLVHGYPESSWMWREQLSSIADAGWRAIAPDLAGFGDSPPDRPGTWERHVESLERLHTELELGAVALLVHDWGCLIGLRWACDHPGRVRALVVSDGGFFADGSWHDLAQAMRTAGTGERLVNGYTREAFGAALAGLIPGIDERSLDEYWKAFADESRRHGQLELYRSGDFGKLERYAGRLAALGVPALIIWGENDQFAPVAGAHRFLRELPGARLELIEGAGHFIWDEQPERCAAAVTAFLRELGS